MKCILHIGTEKTGTTAVQSWLYKNEVVLKSELKWGLLHNVGGENNRYFAANFQTKFDDFHQDHKIINAAEKQKFFETFPQNVSRQIDHMSNDVESVVISSEHLSSRLVTVDEISALKGFLNKFFDEILVIVFFREQSSLRKSFYSTYIKAGGTKPIEGFLRDEVYGYYFDHLAIADNWQEVFGEQNLSVNVFEEYVSPTKNVCNLFLDIAGGVDDKSIFYFSQKRSNGSLSLIQSEILRLLNLELGGRYTTTGDVNKARVRIAQLIEDNPDLKFGDFTTEFDQEIFSKFEEKNKTLAKKYLKKDTNPFTFMDKTDFGKRLDENEIVRNNMQFFQKVWPLIIDAARAIEDPEVEIRGLKRLFASKGVNIDLIRDAALCFEADQKIERDHAINLMKVVQMIRSEAPVPRRFLDKHTSDMD